MPVNTERADYLAMALKWARLRDCDGGRDAILKAGAKYVPDLPGGDAAANIAYRARGNFFNATQRTVAGLVGSVFQSPPTVEVPPALRDWLADVTLGGDPFETFAGAAGREVMLLSRHGVLVDMPSEEPAPGAPNRPYLVGYRAEDVINWRSVRQGGDDVLVLVVLRETGEDADDKDEFKATAVEQWRSLQLVNGQCVVQKWRRARGGGNAEVDGPPTVPLRRGEPLAFIPFVFIGGPDLANPPLLDLADVNLAHWRNSVDHEYGLHLVALPTPWVSGTMGQREGPMKIGPSVVWELAVNGAAGMLEFQGSGLASIVAAMDEKKKQMATLGARMLEDQATADRETATAVRMRHGGEHASLRTVAGDVEVGLSAVLRIAAWWVGTDDKPADAPATVTLNKEYLNVKATAQEVQVALTALQAGEISFETWWNLLSTGGWGREGIDAAAERAAIDTAKALAPEPALDPALSPGDPAAPPAPAAPKRKVITGPDGAVKYTISEEAA